MLILIILSDKDYQNLEKNYDFWIELNSIKGSLIIFLGNFLGTAQTIRF